MRNINLIDKAFLLKKTSLFGALDLDLLLTIADKMEYLHFRQNEKVFQHDQEAHRMYLIVSGLISVQDNAGETLAELKSGDFFGDESMFSNNPRTYAASCETPTTLLALSRSHLLSIITECPSVALSLLEAYSTNLVYRGCMEKFNRLS